MAERFVTFDITEVEEFIDNEENSNTRRKTKNNIALLSSFMAKEKENRQFEEILPQELDNYLSRFLLSVRKKNGEEYELKKCRYSMVYGMADSCLYMDLCEHSKIRKFHISARPSIILYLQENPEGSVRISKDTHHSI